MMLTFLKVLTEYISIVLCLHRVAGRKIKIDMSSFVFVCVYFSLLYLSEYSRMFNILVYVFWFAYTRIKVTDSLKGALKSFGMMIIIVPTLQVVVYEILVSLVMGRISNNTSATMVKILMNIIVCVIILLWKMQYLYNLGMRLKDFSRTIVFMVVAGILIYVIYTYRISDALGAYSVNYLAGFIVLGGLIVMILGNAEMEKRHKVEELKAYEQYTDVFEDAMTAIKMRQHEFDNHINAIQCMQYTIDDKEELIKQQQEYCKDILKENEFNKVLLLKVPPILSGYLYSKFTIAGSKGICIRYEIQEIDDKNWVAMNDLVEIIGILFDNAVEELAKKGRKNLRVAIYYDDNDRFVVEVANESDKISNAEIEEFFRRGYSTKGEGRGIGLYRLNALKKKYKADVYTDNITIDELNYLRFQVVFPQRGHK